MELQNENSSLVSEVASKPKRARTDDVDEEGNFLSDEDVEAGDESLEVADLSWESEHAPVRSVRPFFTFPQSSPSAFVVPSQLPTSRLPRTDQCSSRLFSSHRLRPTVPRRPPRKRSSKPPTSTLRPSPLNPLSSPTSAKLPPRGSLQVLVPRWLLPPFKPSLRPRSSN